MTFEEAEKVKESFKDNSTLTHYPYCKVRENLYIVPFREKDREAYFKKWLALHDEGSIVPDSLAKIFSDDKKFDVQLIFKHPYKKDPIHKEWADTLNKIHRIS